MNISPKIKMFSFSGIYKELRYYEYEVERGKIIVDFGKKKNFKITKNILEPIPTLSLISGVNL